MKLAQHDQKPRMVTVALHANFYVALQDLGDQVWFGKSKVRELK